MIATPALGNHIERLDEVFTCMKQAGLKSKPSKCDDVVIATQALEDHKERLDEVFTCMKQAGLKSKPSKCEILSDFIKYLGHLVDKHEVRPDPEAVEAVLTRKAPKTDTQLISFLD